MKEKLEGIRGQGSIVDARTDTHPANKLNSRIGVWVIGALALWQIISAFVVRIDLYDGYDTVINARYFAGLTDVYVYNRAPLMAWVLAPVERLRDVVGAHPLDMRLHHIATSLLHIAYLLGAYLLLVKRFGATSSSLLAFVAAIPTFVFFSYAPFISHDLVPGAILLAMLYVSARYRNAGGVGWWLLLVGLGAAAPLIKHTYALFWVAVLLGEASVVTSKSSAGRLRNLTAGALSSAVIVWLALMASLNEAFPDTSIWLKPLEQARFIMFQPGSDVVFPWWLYIRNAPAYGVVTALLVIPGVIMNLRGRSLDRRVAVAWLFCIVVLALLSHREVRYLAFLAPLSAFLIVAPLRWLVSKQHGSVLVSMFLMATLLPLNPYSPLSEAVHALNSFHRGNAFVNFLEPLESGAEQPNRVLMNTNVALRSGSSTPILGDPFHRIFEVSFHHIAVLYAFGMDGIEIVNDDEFRRSAGWPPGTAVVWSTAPPGRNPPTWAAWTSRAPTSPTRTLAVCEAVNFLSRADGSLETESGERVYLTETPSRNGNAWHLSGTALAEVIGHFDVELRFDVQGLVDNYAIEPEAPDRFRIENVIGRFEISPRQTVRVRGFSIKRVLTPQADDA